MELTTATLIGVLTGISLLLKWLHVQTRDNKQGLEQMVKDSYTKVETKDLIDLKLKPIEVGIEHVQSDLKELKLMIGRLLDEKNSK